MLWNDCKDMPEHNDEKRYDRAFGANSSLLSTKGMFVIDSGELEQANEV